MSIGYARIAEYLPKQVLLPEGEIVTVMFYKSTAKTKSGTYTFRVDKAISEFDWSRLIKAGIVEIWECTVEDKRRWFKWYERTGENVLAITF